MAHDSFPSEVRDRLGWYVYRLIDPRNGETFYVGNGEGDRVFQHVRNALSVSGDGEDAEDLKVKRIQKIRAAGLDVGHVIHRHGIETEEVAYQIEAALIDAYSVAANQIGGHGSGDYGVRHADEIIAEYKAHQFEPKEPLILISVARSFDEPDKNIYDATRCCWRINPKNAERRKFVLAHRRGLVIEAFRPERWVKATKTNFPWLNEDVVGRWGFEGEYADGETRVCYVGKRVPDRYRVQGAQSPIRYVAFPATT